MSPLVCPCFPILVTENHAEILPLLIVLLVLLVAPSLTRCAIYLRSVSWRRGNL